MPISFPLTANDLEGVAPRIHGSFCDEIRKLGQFDLLVAALMLSMSDGCNYSADFLAALCEADCESTTSTTTACELNTTSTTTPVFDCTDQVPVVERVMNAISERNLATKWTVNPSVVWTLNGSHTPLTNSGTYNGKTFYTVPDGYFTTASERVQAIRDIITLMTDPVTSEWLKYYIPEDSVVTGTETLNTLWVDGVSVFESFEPSEETYDVDLATVSSWLCQLTNLVVYPEADLTAESRSGQSSVFFPEPTYTDARIVALNAYNSGAWGGDVGGWGVQEDLSQNPAASIFATRFRAAFNFSFLNPSSIAPEVYWKVRTRDEYPAASIIVGHTETAPHANVDGKYYQSTIQPNAMDLGSTYTTPLYGYVIPPIDYSWFVAQEPEGETFSSIVGWVVKEQIHWTEPEFPPPQYFALVFRSNNPSLNHWNYYSS